MNEAHTNTKLDQLTGAYVPGKRDDEKTALENMGKAKAKFDTRKDLYDQLASRHQFHVDEAASHAAAAKSMKLKIQDILRNLFTGNDKNVIKYRAEMREELEMDENHLFLAGEVSGPLAESKIQTEKAANEYRVARTVAMELISDNMMDAAIGEASAIFLAMYARVTAFQEGRASGERDWFEMGFDSLESAVIADVSTRIARLYRTLDEDYMRQMLPPPIGVPLDVGSFGEGSPATWHKARVATGANPEPGAA